MNIPGYALSQVAMPGVQTHLYPHQAAMLDEWKMHDAFVLVTKTGSGKTRATALPVLKHQESAVFVYPTNALIQDQARAIRQLMDEEKISYREWLPENATENFGSEEYLLVQINADTLAAFAKAWGMGEKGKGTVLLRLLQSDKRKIILINPDILYLLYSLRYRASHEALAYLQAYSTIVFDEFHLYNGVELAHALFLIHLARALQAFSRVVLLSATPNVEVKTYLDRLLQPRWIDATITTLHDVTGQRTVAHDVELLPLPSGENIVTTAKTKIIELIEQFTLLQQDNREQNILGDYVPAVIILNSVINAIALEDALVEAGIPRTSIAPFRGLSARGSRNVRGKLLVLGTSAIEVGIDFKADYLLFEAGDAASFLQRFGRIGRHRHGKAYLMGSQRECQAIMSQGVSLTRDELERVIGAIYPQQDAKAWFVETLGGAFSIIAQAENFRTRIMGDRIFDETMRQQLNDWLDATLTEYRSRMQLPQMARAKQKVRRGLPWFAHYQEIDSFRTSLPTQEVWDVREKENEREWSYSADVKMLLTRAERLWFNEKHNRLYVKGYGRYHAVWFGKSFEEEREEECCGIIRTTADYSPHEMQFIQEGHLTSLSHVMTKPQHHIFTLAPAELISTLDWRLAWFRCGGIRGTYIIGFDADALLLAEIYRTWKKNQ